MAVFDALGSARIAVLGWYVILSVALFVMYGRDKAAAEQGRWRTPELTLHLMSLGGGWPGALVAQRVFRHKTRKQPFQTIFWFTVAGNCLALAWFIVMVSGVPG